MTELRVVRGSSRKSIKAIASASKDKDAVFEGSEDIQMSHEESDVRSMNGSPRSTVQQIEEEGPRIGKDKMMSPKKVTNKRTNSIAAKFSTKLEKEVDNKENKNIGNLEFPKHDPDESGLKGQSAEMTEKMLTLAKKEHTRGFSFNPSPKSIRKNQDKGLTPDVQLEGGDAYAQLDQTT